MSHVHAVGKSRRSKGKHRKVKQHREAYTWLGAGAITLGVGAAMASGAGVAHADDGSTSGASSGANAAGPSAKVHKADDRPNHKSGKKTEITAAASSSDDRPTLSSASDVTTFKTSRVFHKSAIKVADTSAQANTLKARASKKLSPAGGSPVEALAVATEFVASDASSNSAQAVSKVASASAAVAAAASSPVVATIPVFLLDPEIYPQSSGVVSTGSKAYVTANDGLHVVDIATNSVVKVLPIPAGTIDYQDGLNDIALSPNGKTVYVAGTNLSTDIAQPSQTFVTTVDTGTDAVTGTVQLTDVNNPGNTVYATSATLSPDGKRLFVPGVSVGAGAPLGQYVWAINTTTNQVVNQIGLPDDFRPSKVGVSPDGSLIYVGGTASGNDFVPSVNVINVADGSVARTIQLPNTVDVSNVTLSPNGKSIYLLGSDDQGNLQVVSFNSTSGTQLAAVTIQGSFSNFLPSIVVSPNSQRLYITTVGSTSAGQTPLIVSAVDLTTNAVTVSTVSVGGSTPFLGGLAVSPDGSRLTVTAASASDSDPSSSTATVVVLDVSKLGGTGVVPPPPPVTKPIPPVVLKVLTNVQKLAEQKQKDLQNRVNAAIKNLNNLQALSSKVNNKILHDLATLNIPALYKAVANINGIASDLLEITKTKVAKLPGLFSAAVGVANIPNTITELEKNLEVALNGGNGNVFNGINAFVKSLVGVAELTIAVAAILYGGTATSAAVAVVDLFVSAASYEVSRFDRILGN